MSTHTIRRPRPAASSAAGRSRASQERFSDADRAGERGAGGGKDLARIRDYRCAGDRDGDTRQHERDSDHRDLFSLLRHAVDPVTGVIVARFVDRRQDYGPATLEKAVPRDDDYFPALVLYDPERLVTLAGKIRNIREHGLTEGASTRLLIYAASLIRQGVAFKAACTAALLQPLTDDDRIQETLSDLIDDLL